MGCSGDLAMKIIWTKSSLPLSKLIRWGLKEESSHIAIVFDDKIVFQSNLFGVHIDWFNSFKKKCTIVYEIEQKLPLEQEEAIYQAIINKDDGKSYDYKAFAYFIWCGILKKFFNKPLPAVNKWNNVDSFICVELLSLLPEGSFPNQEKLPKDLSMMSPEMVHNIIK